MNTSRLTSDSYLPGALVAYAQANDYTSETGITLDGSTYNDVWQFFDSVYDDCQISIDLPCPCLVRFEVGCESIWVNNHGGIGCVWVAKSLTTPSNIYSTNDANVLWKTRLTDPCSGYSSGLVLLNPGTHYFRPIWKIQSPYIFSMRYGVFLTVTAWRR